MSMTRTALILSCALMTVSADAQSLDLRNEEAAIRALAESGKVE